MKKKVDIEFLYKDSYYNEILKELIYKWNWEITAQEYL